MNWREFVYRFDFKNYFIIDNIIQFYSGEFLELVPIIEAEEKFPLSSRKQKLALKLIDDQCDFIDSQIKEISNTDSEEFNDLTIAKNILNEMKIKLPRMTIAEVKRNWSISFGAIQKWCGEKFIQFLKIDKANSHDISRTIGSFVGGVLGIPKIES